MMTVNTSLHRLLDEAFFGVPMTPEAQDLKEEVRVNLLARTAELEAAGAPGEAAARRAIEELGDVRSLLADEAGADGVPVADAGAPGTPGSTGAGRMMDAHARHRVRRKPGFVVSVVVAALVGVGALVAAVLGGAGVIGLALPGVAALLLVGALAVGWIVAGSLAQETMTNHPMPRGRAALFGVATALAVLGVSLGAEAARLAAFAELEPVILAVSIVGLVAGVVLFAWLGATQTNRRKPWVLEEERRGTEAGNRFERDPAAAARFGIYTAVLWGLTGAAALIVGATAGWSWVWLPGVVGWAVFMLMLATMLFGAKHTHQG
jgi:MFS family permease